MPSGVGILAIITIKLVRDYSVAGDVQWSIIPETTNRSLLLAGSRKWRPMIQAVPSELAGLTNLTEL